MAASTATTLNDLFSSTLTSDDADALAAIVEDYFCIDTDSQEDFPLDDGKYIHYTTK